MGFLKKPRFFGGKKPGFKKKSPVGWAFFEKNPGFLNPGLWQGEKFWLHLTTASAQCVSL